MKARKMLRMERECVPGWVANERNPERHRALFRAVLALSAEFGLGLGLEEEDSAPNGSTGDAVSSYLSGTSTGGARRAAWEASEHCLQARRCLRHCYALKYYWPPKAWARSRLNKWVPALEGIVSALESALGLVLIEAAVQEVGFHQASSSTGEGAAPPKVLPKVSLSILRRIDLRQVLPHAVAISENLGAVRQLGIAVSLQTARILDSGRAGWPEVGEVELEEDLPDAGPVETAYRRARSAADRCCVM